MDKDKKRGWKNYLDSLRSLNNSQAAAEEQRKQREQERQLYNQAVQIMERSGEEYRPQEGDDPNLLLVGTDLVNVDVRTYTPDTGCHYALEELYVYDPETGKYVLPDNKINVVEYAFGKKDLNGQEISTNRNIYNLTDKGLLRPDGQEIGPQDITAIRTILRELGRILPDLRESDQK